MTSTFHWADYVIFVGFLSISLAIGVFHALTGGRQRTTGEFIMANRKLKVIPTVLSMTMSHLSAILVIGQVAECYDYGIAMMAWFASNNILTGLFLERLIVPWIFSLRLVSVYEVCADL